MIIAALVLAAAGAASTPGTFVDYVYSQYHHDGFSPLEKPENFFSPKLTAAIRKDSSGGEVGYLDGDPLCDCQDYDRVSAHVRKLVRPTPQSAVADVHVVLGPREMRNLELKLTLTPRGWRISDVIGTDGKSLLKELQRANSHR
jgi:hypothetical protein